MRFFLILLLLIPAIALADSIELTWDIPTIYEDGSTLAIEDIDGYVIKYGRNYIFIDSGLTQSHIVQDVSEGVHAFKIATMAGGQIGKFSPYAFASIDGTVKVAESPIGLVGK